MNKIEVIQCFIADSAVFILHGGIKTPTTWSNLR